MNNLPKISVCIPTFNGAKYLQECLKSLESQTYKDFEIVMVDDGSSDNTFEILSDFVKGYSKDRVCLKANRSNLGLVANWNRCIELSTGKWVKFLFQDDLLEPTCLERMIAAGEKEGSLLVFCRRDFIFESVSDELKRELEEFTTEYCPEVVFVGDTLISAEKYCEALLNFGTKNFMGEPTGALIRRDTFARYGLFDPKFVQLCDLEYWHRVGVSHGFAYVPETLVHFRVHSSSTTAANASDRLFKKAVVDPLLLRSEFAYGSNYEPLRKVGLSSGQDLRDEYRDALVWEQRWGPDYNNSEWLSSITKFPVLKMPFSHSLRKYLYDKFVAPS